MKNLLVWSFGNADIYFDGKLLEQYSLGEFENKSFVEKVQILIDAFDKYKEKIEFKMIDSFVDKNKVYDFVGIFTKSENGKFDTYILYDLLEKYFDYKNYQINLFKKIDQIVLKDAFDEEKIFDIFQLELTKIKDFIENIGYEKVFVNITGGTKIMVLLLVCGVKSIFKENEIDLVYGIWDRNRNNTRFIKVNKFINNC